MNTHRAAPNAARIAYLGSWLIFAAVILVMEGWSNAGPLYLFIGGLAFLGVLTGALWTFRDKWVYAALGSSLALLAAYALWWTVDIGDRYTVDPEPGLLRTISVQFEIWIAMARTFISQSHYLYAFCQLYWGVLMALLQLAFLPALVRSVKSLRTVPAGALVA